jgi:hypothetical protein
MAQKDNLIARLWTVHAVIMVGDQGVLLNNVYGVYIIEPIKTDKEKDLR